MSQRTIDKIRNIQAEQQAKQKAEQPITNTNNHPLGLAIFALNEGEYNYIIDYLHDYIDEKFYRTDDEKLRLIKINVIKNDNDEYIPSSPSINPDTEEVDLLTIILSKDDIGIEEKKEFIKLLFYTFNETLEPYKFLVKQHMYNKEKYNELLSYLENELNKQSHLLQKQTRGQIKNAKKDAINEEKKRKQAQQQAQQQTQQQTQQQAKKSKKRTLSPEEIKRSREEQREEYDKERKNEKD